MITRTEDDDRAGDRYVLAYALSIFIHFFLLALFAVRILLPIDSGSTAPQTETVAVTSQRATISSAAPVTPAPVTPPPETPPPQTQPVQTPPPQTPPPQTPPPETPPPKRVPPRRIVARPRVVRQAPHKSDLAVLSPDGTPEPQHITIVAPEMTLPPTSQPSPEPSVATLSPTLPPVKITPPPETPKPETPQPTVPPTVKPTIVPTVKPTIVPTAKPTVIPTLKPTLAPTVAPSVLAQVTVRPTVAPTVRPTIVPTAKPTAAPTKAPTAAPTAIPTAAQTAAPVVARLTPAPLRTAGTALASANPEARAGAAGRATAAPKAGTSAGKSPRSASATGGLEGAGGAGGAEKGTVAYAPSGASNPAASGSAESNLNKRLNALLPSGPVAYENKEYIGDLNAAVDQAKAAAVAAVAPPQSVLDHAIAVVRQHGVLLDASSSIVYIIKRQRIFGFNICTGWKISYPVGGGAPQGGYTVGPCSGEAFAPSGGLPTLPPKAQATP
jgi:hypothetical protein